LMPYSKEARAAFRPAAGNVIVCLTPIFRLTL
jgi:hypothetical protein